jgi:hypothetical protein
MKPNSGFESSSGGMTVYYTPTLGTAKTKVTAFKKGFRMIIGICIFNYANAQLNSNTNSFR